MVPGQKHAVVGQLHIDRWGVMLALKQDTEYVLPQLLVCLVLLFSACRIGLVSLRLRSVV